MDSLVGTGQKHCCSTENLCLAAVAGDFTLLEKQIQSGVDINRKHDSTGLFPLHFAVKGHNIKCLELLLSQKTIDVNCVAVGSGETPLHMAVKSAVEMGPVLFESEEMELIQICKQLVDHGADILALSAEGKTSLGLALTGLSSGSIRLPKLLLARDLLHNHKDEKEVANVIQTPGTSVLFQILKEIGSTLEDNSDQNADLIKVALKFDAMMELLDIHGKQLIMSGFGNQLSFLARTLVESKQFAGVLNELKMFDKKLLLQFIGNSLTEACASDDNFQFESITDALTKEIIALFNKLSTPFENQPLIACLKRCYFGYSSSGHENGTNKVQYERMEKLLQMGFDPNVPVFSKSYLVKDDDDDADYYSSSWIPIYHNLYQSETVSLNIISFFIHKLDGRKLDSELAVEFVKLLLKHGANSNAVAANEISPLMVVCDQRNDSTTIKQIFKELLSNGADLNYKSSTSPFKCSNMALAAAVLNGYFLNENVEILIVDFGLNPMDILTDLASFHYSTAKTVEGTAFTNDDEVIIQNIAMFIEWLLYDFSIKWAPVLNKVRQIQHSLLGVAAPPASSAAEFDRIHAMFTGEVPTLQSICREKIRETVAQGKLHGNMKTKIKRLPLPPHVKKYLNFPNE